MKKNHLGQDKFKQWLRKLQDSPTYSSQWPGATPLALSQSHRVMAEDQPCCTPVILNAQGQLEKQGG